LYAVIQPDELRESRLNLHENFKKKIRDLHYLYLILMLSSKELLKISVYTDDFCKVIPLSTG
jgi:hypothetical protein